MEGIKDNQRADAIGNLYRVALFLAQGNRVLAKSFLEKSASLLSRKELGDLAKFLGNFDRELTSSEKEKYWAEKALDKYKNLMSSLLAS